MSKTRQAAETKNFCNNLDSIEKSKNQLEKQYNAPQDEKILISQVEEWKKDALKRINETASKVIHDVRQSIKKSNDNFKKKMEEMNRKIQRFQKANAKDEKLLEELDTLVKECQNELAAIQDLEVVTDAPNIIIRGIVLRKKTITQSDDTHPTPSENSLLESTAMSDEDPTSHASEVRFRPHEEPGKAQLPMPQPRSAAIFPPADSKLQALFDKLQKLPPMDKANSMSGKCDPETTQMETFLKENFGFQNIPNEKIVDGVKAFRITKPIENQDLLAVIEFPSNRAPCFAMTIEEIREWQQTYRVYAPKNNKGLTKQFLNNALRGKTADGPEAFLMKFVVRISTCPILMEFDAKVIPRQIKETWPDQIKLVSVTGVDFACRKHDVDDIRTYITNWQDIFRLDRTTRLPITSNGRDFVLRPGAPKAVLNQDLLYQDLIVMARIRLQACDREQVQIVVETGIGLGVFAGTYIGIDDQVRKLSARAVKQVLEEDGAHYTHIRGVIFALPIFPTKNDPDGIRTSNYRAFNDEFLQEKYRGPIPVLIIDQDMHRLAVHIAKAGFQVSELNPADSHGVFGEYWQNRGPAVEEKLALTTLGLLVQHHLINRAVLDETRYHLI